MGNRTLAIIKPDSVKKNVIGQIITKITDAGFKIKAMTMMSITPKQAGTFYEVHKERPFYADLLEYMSSGPVVPLALEKENAVEDFRKLIGNTDPQKADKGTIRQLYGTDIGTNAIHGSDSEENAAIEIGFFFSGSDIASMK